MKLFVYIYYLSVILLGGFRNFHEELLLHEAGQNIQANIFINQSISTLQLINVLIAIIILFLPLNKWLHLVYGIIVFTIEFYIQNHIFLEKYIILIDFMPILFFFLIHYKNDFNRIRNIQQIVIKVIAIGYVTAFLGKVVLGWLNFQTPITYSYVLTLKTMFVNTTYLNPTAYVQEAYLNLKSILLHKTIDYLVLLFQASAIFVFFKIKLFKWYSLAAVLFHIIVIILLRLDFFYLYILLYTISFINPEKLFKSNNYNNKLPLLIGALTLILFVAFYVIYDNLFFLNNIPFLYVYLKSVLTFICVGLFFLFWKDKYAFKNNL